MNASIFWLERKSFDFVNPVDLMPFKCKSCRRDTFVVEALEIFVMWGLATAESTSLDFGIGEPAAAGSAGSTCVLEEEFATGDKTILGLTALGLRARVLGGAVWGSCAGEAAP